MRYPRRIGHWIGGLELAPPHKRLLEKHSPADGTLLSSLAIGTSDEVATAVQAAALSFPAWSSTPVVKRGEILRQAAKLMEYNKQEIVGIVALETGKSPKDAAGEAQAAIELGYFMAGEGRRFYGQTTTSATLNRFAYIMRQPVGICALITSFNTPIANVAWKAFPALLCGNTAIMKPSEHTPYSAIWFAKILEKAGLPSGVFSVVLGGNDTGNRLVESSSVDLVGFTGSVETGRKINRTASEKLKRIRLELGGKNPLIVCDDADLDWAAECAVLSAFSNAGQRCASASRIIVFDSVYEKFKQKMCDRTGALKIGPTDDDDLGPVISCAHQQVILGQINDARHKAKLLSGGPDFRHGKYPFGYYVPPTILENVSPEDLISQNEIFGPVTCLYGANGFQQALALANNTTYGLTGAIHTSNIHRIQEFINRYRAGVVSINGPTYGSEPHMPFGGLKNSGNGWREPGTQALDAYSEWKTVYLKHDPNLV